MSLPSASFASEAEVIEAVLTLQPSKAKSRIIVNKKGALRLMFLGVGVKG